MLRYTERKHWVNGHQVRGGWYHTLAFSLGNRAWMICWGKKKDGTKVLEFHKYILVDDKIKDLREYERGNH